MSLFHNSMDKANQVDAQIARYLRPPSLADQLAAQDAEKARFMERQQERKAALAASRQELDTRFQALDARRRELEQLDKQLHASRNQLKTPEAIQRYNEQVNERNQRMSSHGSEVAAYNEAQRKYNEEVTAANAVQQQESEKLDEAIDRLNATIQDHNQWHKNNGPSRLGADLNQLFASLSTACNKGKASREQHAALTKVRALRQELARWGMQNRRDTLLVEASLSGEPVTLLVDTGANSCTLTPALVEALGWQEHVGDEVAVNLAGGITIKAPSLLIPQMEVLGREQQYIRGMVLPEHTLGVDGILGMSFLSAYDVEILHREGTPTLMLHPSVPTPGNQPDTDFDVFICHKSADASVGRKIYDTLVSRDYHPFFSPVSVAETGQAQYARAIHKALEACTHMVVVYSLSGGNDKWVESEWMCFVNSLNSARKTGNLICMLCGGAKEQNLPIPLNSYQAIAYGAKDWAKDMISFLAKTHQSSH